MPGISVYLEHILDNESLTEEAEDLREIYVSLLKASDFETQEALKRRIQDYQDYFEKKDDNYDSNNDASGKKSKKLGHIKEKKLINIRQV